MRSYMPKLHRRRSQRLAAAPKFDATPENAAALADMQRRSAVQNTLEWFDVAIADFERTARELRTHRQQFEHAAKSGNWSDPFGSPLNILTYALMTVSNAGRNTRIDIAASRAAELALVKEKAR
jgi:hypothetical protein